MSISTVTNRVAYQGDGTSAVFPFQYRFNAQSDLAVFTFNSSSPSIAGLIANKVLNTDYTISGTANSQGIYPSGANIIFNSSPNAQTSVVIFRSSVVTNAFSIGQSGTIPSIPLNNELDYLTMLIQRNQDLNIRSARLPDGYVGNFDPSIPANVAQSGVEGYGVLINSSRTGFVLSPIGSSMFTGTLPIQYGGTGTNTQFSLGSIIFSGSGGIYASHQDLYWDATNARMGIGTRSPDSKLTISANSSIAAPMTGTVAHFVGIDQVDTRIMIDSYGSSSPNGAGGIIFRRSSGTGGAPTAVRTDDTLGFVGAVGYGATQFGAVAHGLSFKASQNWTDTNQGSYFKISTVANSTATATEQFKIDQDGTLYFRKYGTTQGAVQVGSGGVISAGPLSVGNGGTGTATSYIQYGLIYASSATQFGTVPSATAGTVLISNGSSAPSFQSLASVDLVQSVSVTYTPTGNDRYIYLNSSNFNINLTKAFSTGKPLTIQRNTAANYGSPHAIVGSGCLIMQNGVTVGSTTLDTPGEAIDVVYDGTNFNINRRTIPSIMVPINSSLVITNLGSISSISANMWRKSDKLDIDVYCIVGTPTAARPSMTLPFGLSIDTLKAGPERTGWFGFMYGPISTTGVSVPDGTRGPWNVIYTSAAVNVITFSSTVDKDDVVFRPIPDATGPWASGFATTFRVKDLPIAGWNG